MAELTLHADQLPCAVIGIDSDSDINFVNQALYHLTGYQEDSLVGKVARATH